LLFKHQQQERAKFNVKKVSNKSLKDLFHEGAIPEEQPSSRKVARRSIERGVAKASPAGSR